MVHTISKSQLQVMTRHHQSLVKFAMLIQTSTLSLKINHKDLQQGKIHNIIVRIGTINTKLRLHKLRVYKEVKDTKEATHHT
jgi:hypothetical protein